MKWHHQEQLNKTKMRSHKSLIFFSLISFSVFSTSCKHLLGAWLGTASTSVLQ